MKNSAYAIICLLFSFPTLARSGNLESVIMLSDRLFLEGNYQQALMEYQRAFFFSDQTLKPYLGERIGDCYLIMKDFSSARAFYDSACVCSETNEEKSKCEFKKILCYIKEERFGDALIKLNSMDNVSDSLLLRKKWLYQGVCNFGVGQYGLSYDYFLRSIPEKDIVKRQKLQALYGKSNKLNRPKTGVTIMLSGLIPGSGQISCGDLRNGLNSFLLLGAIAGLGCISAPEDLLIISPLFLKYYLGGLVHTKEIVEKRRSYKRNAFYRELTLIIFN